MARPALLGRLSIRTKITLWFALALIVVAVLASVAVLAASDRIIQKTIRDSLIETVENNIDEIEYFSSIEDVNLASDVDQFIAWGNGWIEIDDDFVYSINEVYSSLNSEDTGLIYGENPISKESSDLAFSDSNVRTVTSSEGVTYYVFDRQLTRDGLEGLWIRGVVSEEQGSVQMADIIALALIALPSLVIVAIIGGYLITRRMFRPIAELTESAEQIRQGDDLGQRIEIGEGSDELHQLARTYNKMFERLDDAFQAERQFTSDASHELRTPLSVIAAQCDLTLRKERSTGEYVEALETIQRQTNGMTRLVDDLLDFTRLELNAERYTVEDIDLSQLVEGQCADMALIGERGIQLRWQVESDVHVRGNRGLLERALGNLVGNAYRYGVDDGHIDVRLTRDTEAKCAVLEVIDDGIGIADDQQDKIFERFYQVDRSRATSGTGLGLALTREILRFCGGTIAVESKLGHGTTFTCRLSLA